MTTAVHVRVGEHAQSDVLVQQLDRDGKFCGPPSRLAAGQEVEFLVYAQQRLLVSEVQGHAHTA